METNTRLFDFEGKDVPRDVRAIAEILKSMGVEDYEPRVVNMLLEFMHRYVSDVLQDAQLYASHAHKSTIDLDDLRLATQAKVNFSFTQPPPREVLLELAQNKNNTPLPMITPEKQAKYGGVLLPPDEYCLTAPNYQMDPRRKAKREKTDANAVTIKQESSDQTPMEISPSKQSSQPNTATSGGKGVPKILFNMAGIQGFGGEKKE